MSHSFFFFVSSLLLTAHLAVASVLQFPTCRLPFHDTYRNHYLILRETAGDFVCMKVSNASSLGEKAGEMLVPLKCVVRQSDGTTQVKFAPRASETCNQHTKASSSSRACKLSTGLRLTGQGGAEVESFDEIFVTHGSFVCVEHFGQEGQSAPNTGVLHCLDGTLRRLQRTLKVVSKPAHSCRTVMVTTTSG